MEDGNGESVSDYVGVRRLGATFFIGTYSVNAGRIVCLRENNFFLDDLRRQVVARGRATSRGGCRFRLFVLHTTGIFFRGLTHPGSPYAFHFLCELCELERETF